MARSLALEFVLVVVPLRGQVGACARMYLLCRQGLGVKQFISSYIDMIPCDINRCVVYGVNGTGDALPRLPTVHARDHKPQVVGFSCIWSCRDMQARQEVLLYLSDYLLSWKHKIIQFVY